MTLDLNKPVQTRDGRKARIICTDKKGTKFSIVALWEMVEGKEIINVYTENGKARSNEVDSPDDLINVPEERWVNLYKSCCGGRYFSTEEAATAHGKKSGLDFIKSIKVEL